MTRKTVSTDIPSIVPRDLYAKGAPRTDGPFVRYWDSGSYVATLTLVPEHFSVECILDVPESRFGQPSRSRFTVRVSWTQPNFGGLRPWFHCGRSSCQRTSGKLYFESGRLLCARCANVAFPSQAVPVVERRRGRALEIRQRLGGEPRLGGPLPPRPKGMHRTTYEKLCAEGRALEVQIWADERYWSSGEFSVRALMLEALEQGLKKKP